MFDTEDDGSIHHSPLAVAVTAARQSIGQTLGTFLSSTLPNEGGGLTSPSLTLSREEQELQHTWKNKMEAIPYEIVADDAFAIKVVAVAGHDNDWVAYQGPSHWSDERVASEGDELLREQALPLFWCMRMSVRRYRSD